MSKRDGRDLKKSDRPTKRIHKESDPAIVPFFSPPPSLPRSEERVKELKNVCLEMAKEIVNLNAETERLLRKKREAKEEEAKRLSKAQGEDDLFGKRLKEYTGAGKASNVKTSKNPTFLFDAETDLNFVGKMDAWYASTGCRKVWTSPIPIKFEHFLYWMYVTIANYHIEVVSSEWAGLYPHATDCFEEYQRKARKRNYEWGYPLQVEKFKEKIAVWLGGSEYESDCYTLKFPKKEAKRFSTTYQEFEKILNFPKLKFKSEGTTYDLSDRKGDTYESSIMAEINNLFLR
jgi:hypothetical protein